MATTIAQSALPAPGAQPADSAPPPISLVQSIGLVLRFCGVMVSLLAAASLPGSAVFAVHDISVQGNQHLSPAAVVARSGIRPGDPRFAVSPVRVAARVETLPRVARAWIHLALDGRVTIEIVERAEHAVLAFGGRYLILDRSGLVMDSASSPGRLPVVTTDRFAPAWIQIGERVPDARVILAIDALDEVPPAVVGQGTKIRVNAAGELVLVTPDGITVRLGPSRGLRERAAVLEQLLAAIRSRRLAVDYLDLRFAGNVVMRPAAVNPGGERR